MRSFLLGSFVFVAACTTSYEKPSEIFAVAETDPVRSSEDAADDPAIWVNHKNPASSVIFGTDKQAGLYAYNLSGEEIQFVASGAVNNVDLRQAVSIGGWTGDIAVASNRSNDSITIYEITDGKIRETGASPSEMVEPYGICAGISGDAFYAFVTYKTGDIIAYNFTSPTETTVAGRLKLETQLEGCVHDDETGILYIGEEERGIWQTDFAGGAFSAPILIDETGSANGLAVDVEGLALYHRNNQSSILVASSQGNNSYTAYDTADGRFLGRFAVGNGEDVDGSQETDGIEAVSAPMGPDFPVGALVVQDGKNRPRGAKQNFKIIDWRDVEAVLDL